MLPITYGFYTSDSSAPIPVDYLLRYDLNLATASTDTDGKNTIINGLYSRVWDLGTSAKHLSGQIGQTANWPTYFKDTNKDIYGMSASSGFEFVVNFNNISVINDYDFFVVTYISAAPLANDFQIFQVNSATYSVGIRYNHSNQSINAWFVNKNTFSEVAKSTTGLTSGYYIINVNGGTSSINLSTNAISGVTSSGFFTTSDGVALGIIEGYGLSFESVYYDRKLSTDERSSYLNFLKSKYNITF